MSTLKDLKTEWEGKKDHGKLRLLMQDLLANRQEFIRGKTMTEILRKYPCLQEGSFVSFLFDIFFYFKKRFSHIISVHYVF